MTKGSNMSVEPIHSFSAVLRGAFILILFACSMLSYAQTFSSTSSYRVDAKVAPASEQTNATPATNLLCMSHSPMPCPVLRALLPTSSSSSQSARMALSNPATQTHPMNLPWVNHGYYCCLPQRQLLWLHGAEGKSHRLPIVCPLPATYFHRNLIGTSLEPDWNLIGTSSEPHRRVSIG